MQRAKLVGRGREWREPVAGFVTGAEAAVSEARAILAETEPWNGDAHDACRGDGCPQWRDASAALADALAAFVEGC